MRICINIITFLFKITGGKFYLDYLLVTNPTSKNKLIRYIYGWAKSDYMVKDGKARYRLSIILFMIHSILFIWLMAEGVPMIVNILVNIYPMWVQIYIGLRCYRLFKWKKLKQINKSVVN